MRNFLILLTLVLCFNSESLYSQRNSIKSDSDFKSYFDKRRNSIDLVEGVYNLKIANNVLNINRYSGIQNNTPFTNNTKCIIYKTGSKYQVYIYDADSEYSYITKTASSTKFLFTYKENKSFLKDMELYFDDKATLKCMNKFRIDEGYEVYADITWNFTFTKIYPTASDYQSIEENTQKTTGTGFAISSNGYIVTNNHVIDKAKSIEVKGVNGNFRRKLNAELVISDKKNDIAILKINDPSFSSLGSIPYCIRQGVADVGENIFVIGYPLTSSMGEEVKLTNGIISSKTGFRGDISTYQISAPVQPGNSGGPLFDDLGNLIGVITAKHTGAENVSYAIKISYLNNLIELLNTPPNIPSINTISNKTLPQKVKLLSDFVYTIVVNDFSGNYFSNHSGTNHKFKEPSLKDALFYYKQAYGKYLTDDLDGAFTDFTKVIELDSNNDDAYFFRGLISLHHKRNYELAIGDFTKCIQVKPDRIDAYFYRGMSFHRQFNYIDAVNDFTSCIKSDPKNTEALFMRALGKSELNDLQGAIKDYDDIIKLEVRIEPRIYKMSTVYNNKAYSLVRLGKYYEALPLVNKALDLDKSEAYIWDTRGEIYYNLEEYSNCIEDMDKAISIQESDNSYYFRGLAKVKQGKKAEGCSDLSKAGGLGKLEAYEAISTYCE